MTDPIPTPEEFVDELDARTRASLDLVRARDAAVRNRAIEEAAACVATSTSRDCCHETADRSIEAIRSLAVRP